jgi:hypothetical protein
VAPDEADPPFDRRCHRVLTPPISRCGGAKGDARAQASPITPPRKGRGDPQPFPSCYIVFPKNTNRAKGSPLTFPGTRPWPSPSESRSAERRPCRPNPPAATPRAMRRPIDSFGFSSDLRSSPRRIPRDGSHASSRANSTALMASRGRLFRFFPSPRRRSRLGGRDANCRRRTRAGGSRGENFPGCKALKTQEMKLESASCSPRREDGDDRDAPGS